MHPSAAAASDDPSFETFYGTGPLSEAETRSIDWVMDTHPNLGWFLDQHSAIGMVIHGWCHDSNQASDPAVNVLNTVYDGTRGVIPDGSAGVGSTYKEFTEVRDWDEMGVTAHRIAGAMMVTTGRQYQARQAAHFYPTSGCSSDHGNWRVMVGRKEKGKRVRGFGMEFGEFNGGRQIVRFIRPWRCIGRVCWRMARG